MPFSPKKAGQIAAFFANKEGGEINILKLMKLIYLADRHSMDIYAHPISDDNWVSMKHGPVLSGTLDLINGSFASHETDWDQWMSDKSQHKTAVVAESVDREALTELSDADLIILERVWSDLGRKKPWELVDYTHENCPEWQDPKSSVIPITPKSMLQALGMSSEAAEDAAELLNEQKEIDQAFAVYKEVAAKKGSAVVV